MSDRLLKESDVLREVESLLISDETRHLNDLEYGNNQALCHVIDRIEDLPSANRPQGKWIGDKCSVCGKVRTWCGWYGLLPNFCPDCGARMRGADDDH